MKLSSDMDVEQQGERLLREAFQNTVDAMENSKGQIFEIYENKSFLVKIITDRGVAFACRYDGKERLKICLSAKRRKFYRVEIIDLDYRCPFALSNPIWIVDGNNKNY